MATHSSIIGLENSMDKGAWQATVHGVLQARILEWVAIPFSGDLPDSGIEPESPTLQADSLSSEPPEKSKRHTSRSWFHWGWIPGPSV